MWNNSGLVWFLLTFDQNWYEVQNTHKCYTNTIKDNHLNNVRAFLKKEPRFTMTLALSMKMFTGGNLLRA